MVVGRCEADALDGGENEREQLEDGQIVVGERGGGSIRGLEIGLIHYAASWAREWSGCLSYQFCCSLLW